MSLAAGPAPSFSAVHTTGIYCREGCAGRPLARNVTRYRTSVAAEAAGYRPCLRCRPDRLPPATLTDAGALVERALLLIGDGALDDATEAALARRLGVTERHLRRLFRRAVGATPSFVARSRRAHFARRLLDETDLPVIDVAAAAGFASVRQMHRVMRAIFRFSPTELRARRRDADRLVADGGIRLRVPYAGPLAFDAMLGYLGARAIPGVERVEGRTYRRTISTHGEPGVIEVAPGGDGHLLVIAHLPTIGALIDDVARCRRLFGLDAPTAGAAGLADDPLLRAAAARHPGLRVPGTWSPFETAVRIVLGQQVSVAGANTLAGRIAEAFGDAVPGLAPMGLSRLFPPAVRLAEAQPGTLAEVGLPRPRAEGVRALAQAYVDGAVALDGGAPLDDLAAALEDLRGIGPWTAQMIALRVAGCADAFPAGDLGLRRAAARRSGHDAPLTQAELAGLAEQWRPHRALAAMHLWLGGQAGA